MVVWILNYHLKTGHLNTGQVKVCYSDVSCIQMFVIQIPTVAISIADYSKTEPLEIRLQNVWYYNAQYSSPELCTKNFLSVHQAKQSDVDFLGSGLALTVFLLTYSSPKNMLHLMVLSFAKLSEYIQWGLWFQMRSFQIRVVDGVRFLNGWPFWI